MKKRNTITSLFILSTLLALLGCSSRAPASPTTSPNLIYTAAAQTADARLTQIFQLTPSATPVTPSPTFDFVKTMAAQTAAALLTQAAAQTPSPQITPSLTSPPAGSSGDKAAYVADVSIPDGTVLAPGTHFTKTWKLQNIGTTTWTTQYSLAFVSGEQMGAPDSVSIPQSVGPGAQINISVDMVAPSHAGSYQGYWKMKNASGQFFNDSVYVLITVGTGGTAQPTSTSTGPTPTSGTPATLVTSLGISVDQGTYSGACPHTFTFTANVTLSQAATLTYNLEAGSETPGFTFTLPGPQTTAFSAGTNSIVFFMDFTSSGTGWVRLHITAPVDKTSNQATFDLTCTP